MKWFSIYQLDFILTIIIHQMKWISCWSFYSENYEKGVFDTIIKSRIHETLHTLWQSRKKNTIDPNQKKLKKNISVRIPVVYQNNRSWNSQNSFSNITINQRQWTKGRWEYKRKIHDAWRSGNHWTITADSVTLKLPITNIEMNPSRLRLVFIKSAKNLHNFRRKYILRFRETMR